MALLSVEQPNSDEKRKPSALENAAQIMGLGISLGSLGTQGYDTFVNKPNQIEATNLQTKAITEGKASPIDFANPIKKKPFLDFSSNVVGGL